MSISLTQASSTGLLGQTLVVAAGIAGAALAAAGGIVVGRRQAVPAVTRGAHAAGTAPLARRRDAIARRSHPVVAATLAAVCGLTLAIAVTFAVGLLTKVAMVIRLDRPLDHYVDAHRIGSVTRVMQVGTLLGGYPVVFAIAIAGGLVASALSRHWLPVVLLVGSVPLEIELQKLIAGLVHGSKPPQALAIGPPGGFFSGGSARTLIVCGLLAYFLCWRVRARRWRALLWALAALAAFVESYSRLYLGRHWAVDIAGGWVFASLVLAALAFAAGALTPPRHAQAGTPQHSLRGAASPSARGTWPGDHALTSRSRHARHSPGP